ncbi:cilia- and flagella-associated protein 53 [Bactrocera oleae]|uniref:cilia- and flagella-associated protein 53 n=1 Tax=Bactrocera oleae TaxID=104688 RepID=UPI00387E2BEB
MLTEQDLAAYFFMKRTDRKSLYTQIKELVKTAQDVAEKELNQRRERLRTMLEQEDKIYEEEFANKVKSRIDEDIQHRKDALFNIKEERNRLEKEFLERKTIQQQFECCYEIREALRRKETLQTKEVQLEQIVEKERAQLRERQLDDYWCKVRDARTQRYDERQADETKKKCDNKRSMRCVLEQQMEMHKKDEERQRESKRKEAIELNKVMEKIRLEDFDRKRLGLPKKMLDYREELLSIIAENKAKRDAAECERIEEHRQLMRDVALEQQEHSAALLQRKRAVYNATMEYLDYARRMCKLEEDTQDMRDARIDDLRHVDICTKSNIQRELQRKAEIAALCYAELRRQMCEEYERRLRDIQEQREPKIIENRFAHPEKTRADIMAERRKMRAGLDEQLIENARIHAEEEAKYNADLKLAINDPEFCTELAKKYLSAGIDYLPPHANWLIYACPQKQFVVKRTAPGSGDRKDPVDICLKRCGCKARTGLECTHHNWSAHKRGVNADEKRRFELESC